MKKWTQVGLLTYVGLDCIAMWAIQRELRWRDRALDWEDQRAEMVAFVIEASIAATRVAIVHSGLKQHIESDRPPGIQYELLKSQALIMIEQEEERSRVAIELRRRITGFTAWEEKNPPPAPPTYFGQRLDLTRLRVAGSEATQL